MFNILNTILVAAIVTAEVYGLFLGVYLMLFEGVTTREGVVTALEGRHRVRANRLHQPESADACHWAAWPSCSQAA